jgi:hypothetical protein
MAVVLTPRLPLLVAEQTYPLASVWVFFLWYRAARRSRALPPTTGARSRSHSSVKPPDRSIALSETMASDSTSRSQ